MKSLRAILTYHSVDESASAISITPAALTGHLQSLAQRNIRVLPVQDLWEEVRDGRDDLGDAVALTFDDGFRNFEEHALPRLREFGFPSTVFVVSGHVGGFNDWSGRAGIGVPLLPLLDWDALGRIAEHRVELGAHTRSHRALHALPPDAVEDEVGACANEIAAHLGVRPTAFAYPYGSISAAARSAVAAHYALGVTTELAPLSRNADSALLPRIDAYYLRTANGLQAWGSRGFRAYLGIRAAFRSIRASAVRTRAAHHQ